MKYLSLSAAIASIINAAITAQQGNLPAAFGLLGGSAAWFILYRNEP